MNQETEQPPNSHSSYVLLNAEYKYIAIPLDNFIEMNGDIVVLKSEGYGDDEEMHVINKPLKFELMNGEQMTALKVKSRILTEKKE